MELVVHPVTIAWYDNYSTGQSAQDNCHNDFYRARMSSERTNGRSLDPQPPRLRMSAAMRRATIG